MRPAHGLLLALLLVCAASLWYGLSGSRSGGEVTDAPGAGAAAVTVRGEDPISAQVLLAVLNGTAVPRLAGDVAMVVGRAGCLAGRIENAPRSDYAHSLLINRRLPDSRAAELARALGGIPLIREADSRADEDAVLVLGADHAIVCRALGLDPPGAR